MKKNAKNGGKRGKKLAAGKKLQKTKTLTTLSGPTGAAGATTPTESLSLNFTKINMKY
jgi:hypothetical protein